MLVSSNEPVTASVIVGSVSGGPWIHVLLDALEAQEGDTDFEVVVADRCSDGTADRIERERANVCVLRNESDTDLPALRTQALDQARGRIVLVTEDHTVPPVDWVDRARRELDAAPAELAGAGGPVENQMAESSIDWATFLCEYHGYLPPQPRGQVDDIPGMNVAYRRDALDVPREALLGGFWETTVHPGLEASGRRFLRVPELVIGHRKRIPFGLFMRQRFHYSRAFAGRRFRDGSFLRRVIYAGLSPALVVLVPWRIVRAVWPRPGYRGALLGALPWLLCFALAWAVGEFVGYLSGPGHSMVEIE